MKKPYYLYLEAPTKAATLNFAATETRHACSITASIDDAGALTVDIQVMDKDDPYQWTDHDNAAQINISK
jgi:hypothetical protein